MLLCIPRRQPASSNERQPASSNERQLSETVPLDFSLQLESLLSSSDTRQKLVNLAKANACGDVFLFLAAIIDWERISNAKERKARSLKLVSLFVELGGTYANCMPLSEQVRDDLLDRKRVGDSRYFSAAKIELVRWIYSESKIKLCV